MRDFKQRKTEEFSKQPCCRWARVCFSVNHEKAPPLHVFLTNSRGRVVSPGGCQTGIFRGGY